MQAPEATDSDPTMSSNIICTNHDALDNDHKGTVSRLHGKSVPTGFAGYVPQDAGFAVCHECAVDEFDDELRDDEGGIIFGDAESDYPGTICDSCQEYLDVTLLVYQSNDPKLYFRLRMTEELGGNEWDDVYSIEEIGKRAADVAYTEGWEHAEAIEGSFGDGGEFEDDYPELPTDSANWANNIAPRLRSIAGFEDGGHGTYQKVPIDVAYSIHNEDVLPAFIEGYKDRAMGRKYEANR